jgi:chromosomal replication initiator protein
VLGDLAQDPAISRASFATWLRGTQLLDAQGNEFTVGAQHSFALEKLERSFRGAIEAAVRRQTDNPAAHVRFVVTRAAASSRPAERATPPPLPLKSDEGRKASTERSAGAKDEAADPLFVRSLHLRRAQGTLVGAAEDRASRAASIAAGLNPQLTFETFAVSRETQFAYAAACAVADNPSFAYNPLVLFGPPHAGKTHLLHAIGHRVRALRSGAQVVWVSAQTLATDWLRSGASREVFAAYREQYSHADVLLLDDLQLVPALGAVGVGLQLELASIVARLLAADAQVVVASHLPPRALTGLDERLRERLQSGLVAELSGRDVQVVPKPAGPPPVPLPAASRRRIGSDDIVGAVATYFGVPADALLSKRRDKEVVGPRQVAMYLLREGTGLSLSEIGQRLGGRDHSTVLHGHEKVAAQLPHDPALRRDVAALRQQLGISPGSYAPGAAAAAAAAP